MYLTFPRHIVGTSIIKMPQSKTKKAAEKAPVKAVKKASVTALKKASEKAAKKAHEKAPKKVPGETSEKAVEKVTKKVPEDTSEKPAEKVVKKRVKSDDPKSGVHVFLGAKDFPRWCVMKEKSGCKTNVQLMRWLLGIAEKYFG